MNRLDGVKPHRRVEPRAGATRERGTYASGRLDDYARVTVVERHLVVIRGNEERSSYVPLTLLAVTGNGLRQPALDLETPAQHSVWPTPMRAQQAMPV